MSKTGKSFIRYLIWFIGSLLVLYVFKDYVSPLLIYYFGVILGGVSYILTELS